MTEQNEVIGPTTTSSTVPRSNLLDNVRQLAYAWVGMWSVVSDDAGNFYQRCVARGEQVLNAKSSAAQPDGQLQMPDTVMSQPITAASRRIRPLSIFNAFGAVETYHLDLNVDRELPTKAELDALIEQVEALSREVDALADQRHP